jgi:TolB-like protein
MSPEQAKGTHLDARSDLWSVGALLYEMVTKHLPFAGETPTETISLILQKEPAPLLRYANNVPAELERLVTKALTKDPEGRYQTAKDLLIDLRNLKRKLEVDAEIDRTVPPELRAATSTAGGSQAHSTASNVSIAGTAPPSSAEYIVSGIKRHKVAVVLLVLLLAGGALGVILYGRRATPSLESIAVLPFVNASGDPNMEYLSDGISETLINSLTQLQRLHVVARATAFRYKGKETDPQVVGRELNVRTVLMGRVRQKGDTLSVQVDLVDASTGAQLWGEEFERQATDVLSVKQAISREIIDKLRLRLTGEEQQKLVGSDSNGEAYELYLKGRYYWNKRDGESLEKSVEYLNQAIAKDPNYALAYAGLADSWFTAAWYRLVPPQVGYEKAREAANKALTIDQNLAEAHTTLGAVKAYYDWDWTGGEEELKRAIELNPNYPTAHQRYSLFLPIFGRFDEAIAEAKRAQQLDPLSLILNENVGDAYQLARRYDEAEAQLKKTLELDPNFYVARGTLARLYEAKGMYKEALQQNLAGARPEIAGKVMKLYDEAGIQGVWRVQLADMLKNPEVSPMSVAQVYVKLGDKDKAFEWLNKALDTRGVGLTYLVADARFDSIRSDPRYIALLERANLKPIQIPR